LVPVHGVSSALCAEWDSMMAINRSRYVLQNSVG
jgi:hypothetical protein